MTSFEAVRPKFFQYSFDDQLYSQNSRTVSPLVWNRLATGLKITDLQQVNFKKVTDIILEYYVTQNVVFKNTKFLEDPDSIKSYRERLIDCMMDSCSLAAVKEENDEIVGVLLLKIVQKSDYGRTFSRVELSSGRTYASILRFMNAMQREVDIYDEFKCDVYLRYYLLCIKPEYRREGVGMKMVVCGLDIARYHRILVVMGIMDGYKMQNIGKNVSMRVLYEVSYRKYHDEDGELIFCDCDGGSNSCALMAGIVPPAPEPQPNKRTVMATKNKKNKDKKKGKGIKK